MKKIRNISSLKIVTSAIILSLMFTGCGETDTENEGNHKPDVNIVQNDKTVKVGELVKLDGIATDVDNDALVYYWEFISKPIGSLATLTTSSTKKVSFTADKAGIYKVRFTANDELKATNSKVITITATSNICTSYTELSATVSTHNIETDTTLDGCYKIVDDLWIEGDALLTIKPGSTILFAEDTTLHIRGGALKAVGTAQNPILFSGVEKSAGHWQSINFEGSNNPTNEIAHAIFEYGGGLYDRDGALQLTSGTGTNRLKLSNTTFRNNLYHGFAFEEGSQIDKFENITSTKNGKTAGVVHMSQLAKLDSQSDFTGNLGDDYITVTEGVIDKDTTWNSLSVPIHMQTTIDIRDAVLTLKPGIKIIFDEDEHINTDDGALKAIGTAKDPIILTGREKSPGYWNGLKIDTNSPNNILNYVTLEYAGGYNGALELNSPARISVTNSIFKDNANYAIYIENYSGEHVTYNKDIQTINTFINNEGGNFIED